MSREIEFKRKCRGRLADGHFALEEPIDVTVRVSEGGDNTIEMNVRDCPYNTGGHGQRCKASHPDVDKIRDGISCPYSVDVPYGIDYFRFGADVAMRNAIL